MWPYQLHQKYNWRGVWNKALSDFWWDVKFSSPFTTEYKEIWKENLVIYQKSLKAFLQAPLQLLQQEVPALCPLLSTSDPIAWKRWQGRSQGGVLGWPWSPLLHASFNQTTYNRWRKWHDNTLAIVTIWWVPSLWHSVTPPLKIQATPLVGTTSA